MYSVSVLRTPHAACIFMSYRVPLVKPNSLQVRSLQKEECI